MRLRPTYFVLLLLLIIGLCNGVSPNGVGEAPKTPARYTEEEDKFIVEELSRLSEDYIPPHSTKVWKPIAENHREKWKAGTQGFGHERSMRSLISRLNDVLIHNLDHVKVKVPDTLKRRFIHPNLGGVGKELYRPGYNQEENDFIIEELKKPSYTSLLSSTTAEGIRLEHDKKRRANVAGFGNERTARGIRSRITTMKDNGGLPNELLKKFMTRRRDDCIRQTTHPNQETNPQVRRKTNFGYRPSYTEEEDKFIVEELSRLPDSYIPVKSKTVWEKIAKNYHEKWKAGTPGFRSERSAGGLRARFSLGLIHNYEHNTVKVPITVMRKFINPKSGKVGSGWHPYSKEEDELIIEALLKPHFNNLLGTHTLEGIRAEFDKKREAKIPGFENKRTARGLGSRIITMEKKGLLPNEITEKIWFRPKGPRSRVATHPTQEPHLQELSDEEHDDCINEMIEELQYNTPFEFDYHKFNSFFNE